MGRFVEVDEIAALDLLAGVRGLLVLHRRGVRHQRRPRDLLNPALARSREDHPCMGPGRLARGLENLGHDHVVLERRQRIRLSRPADDGDQVRDRIVFVRRPRPGVTACSGSFRQRTRRPLPLPTASARSP